VCRARNPVLDSPIFACSTSMSTGRERLPTGRTLEDFCGAFEKLTFPDRDLIHVNVTLLR
jgi:hypothetical protein